MNLYSLEGKNAVVTGALGLIGREHCRALAGAGAGVVVTDLDDAACRQFAAQLREESGVSAIGIGADITDAATVSRLAEETLQHMDGIHILVNNAAINDMVEDPVSAVEASRFENYPIDLWRKCLDVNVTGTFLCSQVFGRHMAEQGRGSIVNIASTYGIVGPDQSLYRDESGQQTFYKSAVYPTAKGAIINFTRFLAAYWGQAGVRVNTLSPGGVENGQSPHFVRRYAERTPIGRMAQPTDYHGALVFLASDASSYMTGGNLVVDGGWTAW